MRRIKHLTAVASQPAFPTLTGVEGFFTSGNPGAGVPATIVPDWWLNMVQEELRNVIVGAGIALDDTGTNLSQLRQAMGTTILKNQVAGADVAFDATATQQNTYDGGTTLGLATLPAGHRSASVSANVYISGVTTIDAGIYLGVYYRLQGATSWTFLEGQSDTKPAGKLMSMSRLALVTLDPTQAYDIAAFLKKDAQTGAASPPSGTISIQGFH